jgi:hypothetical protein
VAASLTAGATAFWNGNCGSGSELGSGDAAENAGPAYSSTAGRLAVTEGLPWFLRPAVEGAAAATGVGDFLVLGFRCEVLILCGCCCCRMLCGRRTSVAIDGEGNCRDGGEDGERDRNAVDCCVGNGETRGYFIWRRETVRQVK